MWRSSPCFENSAVVFSHLAWKILVLFPLKIPSKNLIINVCSDLMCVLLFNGWQPYMVPYRICRLLVHDPLNSRVVSSSTQHQLSNSLLRCLFGVVFSKSVCRLVLVSFKAAWYSKGLFFYVALCVFSHAVVEARLCTNSFKDSVILLMTTCGEEKSKENVWPPSWHGCFSFLKLATFSIIIPVASMSSRPAFLLQNNDLSTSLKKPPKMLLNLSSSSYQTPNLTLNLYHAPKKSFHPLMMLFLSLTWSKSPIPSKALPSLRCPPNLLLLHAESPFPKTSMILFHERPLHSVPLIPPTWKNLSLVWREPTMSSALAQHDQNFFPEHSPHSIHIHTESFLSHAIQLW